MRRRLRKHRRLPNARLDCLQEITQRGLVQLTETRLRIRRDQKTASRRNHHRLSLRPPVRTQTWLSVRVSLHLRSHTSDSTDFETAVRLRNTQVKTRLLNAILNRDQRPHHLGSPPLQINT